MFFFLLSLCICKMYALFARLTSFFFLGQSPDSFLDREEALTQNRDAESPIRNAQGEPLRLLCLHGRGSNNDITHMQMSSIGLSQLAHLDFLEGPEAAAPASNLFPEFSKRPFHTWTTFPTEERKLEQILRYVLRHIDRSGPYDGLFGFSQGAAIVSMLSLPGMPETLGFPRANWAFVICACGVDFGLGTATDLLRNQSPQLDGESRRIPVRSLHLIGKRDHLCASSYQLAEKYENPVRVQHDHGHELPMTLYRNQEFRSQLDGFLAQLS